MNVVWRNKCDKLSYVYKQDTRAHAGVSQHMSSAKMASRLLKRGECRPSGPTYHTTGYKPYTTGHIPYTTWVERKDEVKKAEATDTWLDSSK